MPRLLVFSSYWDRGHSSHRITAPLSKSLTQYTCAYLAHAVTEEVWEATRGDLVMKETLTRYEEVVRGARNRYEDPSGFADVEVFPVTESLSVQLALWSHFRSPGQLFGSDIPGFPLSFGNATVVDETYTLDMSEWEISGATAPSSRATSSSGGGGGGSQADYPFDAVLYPSVGMSPNDMTLSSLRVAATQMVTYGHSSSSQSPVMDIFLGGVEPEVLGPLTSDIYATDLSCTSTLEALYTLLRVALQELGEGGVPPEGIGLVGGWERSSPLRLPMVAVCSGEAVMKVSEGGNGPPRDDASQVCNLFDKFYVSSDGVLGEAPLEALLTGLLGSKSPPLSPRCKTSFPLNQPVAPALYTRLVDAQRRYSERLVLLPGLGLWFTHVFPAYAPPLRRLPTLGDTPSASRALRLGQGILGYLLGGSVGATDGGLEAQLALRGVGGNPIDSTELLSSLHALLNTSLSNIPWPGSSPFDPIEISLVWSVVKWNGRHLDRLLISMHTAQTLWAEAWNKCSAVREMCSTSGAIGGEGKAIMSLPLNISRLGFDWWEEEGGPKSAKKSTTAANLVAALATCAVCEAVLAHFPVRTLNPPPYLAPPLFIRIVSFSTSDGDAMKGAAFRSWVRRTLVGEFPGGTASSLFITNATTPNQYYGRLGQTHLAFDSLPFSACNTMQDVVALRVPTVSAAHDGEFEPGSGTALRWRSSIGASMLTRLGLSGLAAEGEQELIGKASHLIANPLLRAAWKLRMDGADEGELARKQYADRDAQLVAQMLRRRKRDR